MCTVFLLIPLEKNKTQNERQKCLASSSTFDVMTESTKKKKNKKKNHKKPLKVLTDDC